EAGAPAEVLADHPAGYWRLGEPAGSTSAVDASATQLAGSYEPGVTLAQPGAIGGDSAAGFGPGGGVALPASGALDLRGAFSVEAWVRPTVAGQNGGIFEKTVGGAVNSQYMLLLEAGVLKWRVRTAAGALIPVEGPTLSPGSWAHVVGTFDGTTLRLYASGAVRRAAPRAPDVASCTPPRITAAPTSWSGAGRSPSTTAASMSVSTGTR